MFRLLAEHPGPDISAAAAASVAGLPPPQVRAALDELTGSHLLTEHAPGRFAFHDLLRAYAAEQLRAIDSPAERRAAGLRLLNHYLGTAKAAARALSLSRKLPGEEPAAAHVLPEDIAGEDQAMGWLSCGIWTRPRTTCPAHSSSSDSSGSRSPRPARASTSDSFTSSAAMWRRR